ncbi:MAG: hypothetical protein AB1472_01350 [Candidatus Omnitrophota bacterium]
MRIKEWLILISALIAGISGLILIHKTIFNTLLEIHFSEEQSFVCRIDSDNQKLNNKYCFGFYVVYLVSKKELSPAPKQIKFFIKKKWSWKWIEGNPIIVKTNKINNKDNCLVLSNDTVRLIICDWINFLPTLNQQKMSFGQPILGSIIYSFDLKLEEIEKYTEMKFIIEDYLGKKYKYKTKIKEKYFNAMKQNLRVINKNLS